MGMFWSGEMYGHDEIGNGAFGPLRNMIDVDFDIFLRVINAEGFNIDDKVSSDFLSSGLKYNPIIACFIWRRSDLRIGPSGLFDRLLSFLENILCVE